MTVVTQVDPAHFSVSLAVASSNCFVQTAYDDHFVYANNRTTWDRSVAAVLSPQRDDSGEIEYNNGVQIRGSCGVTFVTPRHAITAAHCVDDTSVPWSTRVTVQVINILNVSQSDLMASQELNTSSEGPTEWYPEYPLTSADGYSVTEYKECQVVTRCDTRYGEIIGPCRFENGKSFDSKEVDIALLYCRDKPSSSPYHIVSPKKHDKSGTPVCLHWYHEVYDMPVETVSVGDPGYNEYIHYTYKINMKSNYHYFGGDKNQLMPLRSTPWNLGKGTKERKVTKIHNEYTATDLFGCHGTSGSGVFSTKDGSHKLMGPTLNFANNSAGDGRLCMNALDETNYFPGCESLGHGRVKYTRGLTKYARQQSGIAFPLPGE